MSGRRDISRSASSVADGVVQRNRRLPASLIPASTQRPAGTPSWLDVTLITALFVAPLIALSQWIAVWRMDVVDDQMFGYFGWRIAHGAVVYRDVWDNKPPGIYWINALGFLLTGGEGYWGVLALCCVALIVSHVCIFCIAASNYFRSAAAVTTILASFFLTHAFYQGGMNRTETFLVMFELLGVLCYVRGFARDRWWKWWLAGVFCGGAFLCKQVGLAGWGVMGLHTIVLVVLGRVSFVRGIARCWLLLLGVATTVGIAATVLVHQGVWDDAWNAVVTFNRSYFIVNKYTFFDTFLNRHMLQNHMGENFRLPVLMAIAALIHAGLWWLRPKQRPVEIESRLTEFRPVLPLPVPFFLVWYLVAFYGAALSPHYFRHYLVPTMAPLILLCGYLVNVITTEVHLLDRLQSRAWVVAVFVAMGWFLMDAFIDHFRKVSEVYVLRFEDARASRPHSEVDFGIFGGKKMYALAEWELLGREVRALTQPNDKILCWGYFPGVYLDARRVNANRFTTTEKIGQVGDYADFVRQDLHNTFLHDPPPLIVVSDQDYSWFRNPRPDQPPTDWIGKFLAGWLDQHYKRVRFLPGNIYIYQRNDRAKPEDVIPVDASN